MFIHNSFLFTETIRNNYFIKTGKNTSKFTRPVYILVKETTKARNQNMKYTNGLINREKIEITPTKAIGSRKTRQKFCKNSWEEDYSKLHRHLIQAKRNRFLIYQCTKDRWSNQVDNLLKTFHLAVITKRAFIFKCDSSLPLNGYLTPAQIKWNYNVNETGLTVRKRLPRGGIKNIHDLKNFSEMLNYSVEYAPSLEKISPEVFLKFLGYNVTASTDNYRKIMGCTIRYLFKKSDILQQKLDEWKEKLDFNGNIVIAIGTSSEWGKRIVIYNDIDFSFKCAKIIEGKVEEKYRTKKIIWFIDTDDELITKYSKRKLGSKVRQITGSIDAMNGSKEDAQFKMFLNFFLFQDANYVIRPPVSSVYEKAHHTNIEHTTSFTERTCTIPSSLKA